MKRIVANGQLKEYKNGNITIKFDADTIKDAMRDDILTLDSLLYWLDCYFIGETYCLSNYEMGHTIYNYHSDLVYIFPWKDLETLKAGKTVRLYAMRPNENDREIIESEGL